MRGNMRIPGLVVALAVAIAACGGDSSVKQVSSDSSDGPAASSSDASTPDATTGVDAAAELDAKAVARTNEVLAMPPTERDTALIEAGMQLELDVAEESGLADALGGRETTQAALEAAWAPVQAQALALDSSTITLGLRRQTAAVPDIGEGMFGAYMAVALLAGAGVTEEVPAGPAVSRDSGSGFVLSATQNSVTVSGTLSHTDSKTGVTTKVETQSTVVPCPDANGSFDVSGLMDVSVTKGDAGQHGTLDVQVTGQVDEDARLVSSDMEYQQWSKSSGGSTQLVDVSVFGCPPPAKLGRR